MVRYICLFLIISFQINLFGQDSLSFEIDEVNYCLLKSNFEINNIDSRKGLFGIRTIKLIESDSISFSFKLNRKGRIIEVIEKANEIKYRYIFKGKKYLWGQIILFNKGKVILKYNRSTYGTPSWGFAYYLSKNKSKLDYPININYLVSLNENNVVYINSLSQLFIIK